MPEMTASQRRCACRSACSARSPRPRPARAPRSGSAAPRRPEPRAITASAFSCLAGRHPELLEPPSRPPLDPRLEQRQPPAGVLGRDQVDRHSHHPGAEQRALLGAGPRDVGGGQPAAARAEGQRARVDVLRLRAARSPGRSRPGSSRGGRPVEQLRGGARPGQPGRIDPPCAPVLVDLLGPGALLVALDHLGDQLLDVRVAARP